MELLINLTFVCFSNCNSHMAKFCHSNFCQGKESGLSLKLHKI